MEKTNRMKENNPKEKESSLARSVQGENSQGGNTQGKNIQVKNIQGENSQEENIQEENTQRANTKEKKNRWLKRSDLLLLYLIAAWLLTPFLVYGLYTLFPAKGDLPGTCRQCTVIRIDNPSLTANQVKIFPRPANTPHPASLRSYAYYEGKKKYNADLRVEGTILHIGRPVQAEKDEDLTLHIRLHPLETVELNGQTIWTP